MALLNEFFEDHLISEDWWPAKSSDLTRLGLIFFLWCFLKNRVFLTEPADMEEFKSRMTLEIQSIDIPTLHRVLRNLIRHPRACIEVNGSILNICCKL